MKILVTGGLGFIGRHLSKALCKKGHKIIIIDNCFRWQLKDVYRTGLKENEFEFINGDICDEKLIKKFVKKIDLVIHLASISQVRTSLKFPDKCFDYNVIGTKNIVKYCSKYKKRLIFSSSREVYGTAKYLPVDLNHPLLPENPYGASKIIGESLIKAYANSFGLEYMILRLSNVYGFDDKNRAVPIFTRKASLGENIEIFGNNKIIDFVYIDDVIKAFLLVLEKDKLNNKTFNIGSGISTKLDDLANIIIRSFNSNSKIIRKKAITGEVDRFTADISETTKFLKWCPKIKLEEGLKKIIMANEHCRLEK